jgi:hypothetical protein
MTLRISIETLPQELQRYKTQGDYYKDADGIWRIFISEMKDVRSEIALALHELFEFGATDFKGIKEEDITAFDLNHLDSNDPGSLHDAPYNSEHMDATKVEKIYCKNVGLSWKEHNKNMDEIS